MSKVNFLLLCVPHHLVCRRTCNAHEAVGEDGELHSVELRAQRAVTVRAQSHTDISRFCQTSLTAGLHEDGADGKRRQINALIRALVYITAFLKV